MVLESLILGDVSQERDKHRISSLISGIKNHSDDGNTHLGAEGGTGLYDVCTTKNSSTCMYYY